MWNVPLSSQHGSLQPEIECYGQLTVPRAQLSTHRGYVFFEVFRWQVTIVFNWSQAQIHVFQRTANVLCLWANSRTINFWSETDFKSEKSSSFYRQGRQLLLSLSQKRMSCYLLVVSRTLRQKILALLSMFTRWSRSAPHFYLRLVKIWQVNSSGKFIQHLET